MAFVLNALFALLLTVIAGAAYVARLAILYIGADILKIGWRLLLQGSKIVVAIQEATVFLHLDSTGTPQWVNLLQAVDAVKDVEATPPPPVVPALEGSMGSQESVTESPKAAESKPRRRFSSSNSHKLKSKKVPPEPKYQRVPLNADISAYILRLYLRQSFLELPEHIALIIGDSLDVKGALGMPNVALHADATPGYDSAWCQHYNSWPAATPTTGTTLYPIVLDTRSQHTQLHLQGWRTTTGLLLQQPISLSQHFTPAFAKHAMREMHPLLGSAVGLQGGSKVEMTVHPLEMHLPADCYSVRIQPMRMVIGSNAFLSSLMGLLKFSKMQSTNVEAWTSTVEADIFQAGQIVSKRMDVLLGSSLGSCKGVHVIMWGQVDTANNVMDMTLGIPADTLAATGIKTLPNDYVLPVPVKGTPQSPIVNWAKAVAQLTELSIKRQVSKGLPWLSNVITTLGGPKLDMTDYPTAPPLVGQLPWEAQEASQEDMALGADLIEL